MLSDRGRHGILSAGGVQHNDEDEPESVRRYRQFLAGTSASETEETRSIFISNAPSMLMQDWLTTGAGRHGRNGLLLSPSRQLAGRPQITSASPLSPIEPNPDDSNRHYSQTLAPDSFQELTPYAEPSQALPYPVEPPQHLFAESDSSVVNHRPLTPSPEKPRKQPPEWWNMCTADSPDAGKKLIDTLGREETVSARRALLSKNNWLHSENAGSVQHGTVPTTSLRRAMQSQNKMAGPRVRLYTHDDLSDVEDDPGTIPDGTDTFEHSHLLSKHEPYRHSTGEEKLSDKGSKASSHGTSQGHEFRGTASGTDSLDDTRATFSDESIGIRGPFTSEKQNSTAIKAIVWKQWIAMLSRSEGELGDCKFDRRISSSVESEASIRADPQMTTNIAPAASSQKVTGGSILPFLENITADSFMCGHVNEADRGALQHWCYGVHFGWPKRAVLSSVIAAQCLASFADRSSCGGPMDPWLQAVHICAILFFAGDILLLRFAVGPTEFWKLNVRKLWIFFHFAIVVIDVSLRMAEVQTRYFSRPIWPLLLLPQLPDVGIACTIVFQLIRRIGPLLLAWLGLITIFVSVGTMSVRFACPFNGTSCLFEHEFEDAGVSYRNFPIAIFSVWSLAFGDGYSRNVDALSSIVSPVFSIPFCASALATSSLMLSFIAFALVWHHFRLLCSARRQQRRHVERTAIVKAFDSLCENTPANSSSVSPANVFQALDPNFHLHSSFSWPNNATQQRTQLLDLDWFLNTTFCVAIPRILPFEGTAGNPSRLKVVEEGLPAWLVYHCALGVNVLAFLYGSFLQDANPTKGLDCDPSDERAWDCEGQVALMTVDWVVYGILLSAFLLRMIANHPTAWLSLSFASCFVSVLVETALLAHRHVAMRDGGTVGGLSLLIRLMRLPRLLPWRPVRLATILPRLLARIFPSLIQLSLLLFILVFPLASIFASSLPCSNRDIPGVLNALETPLLGSFHLLSTIAVTNDWPQPLLELLRYLSPSWAGVVAVLLVLWWVVCRVLVAMMVCVTLQVAQQSLIGCAAMDEDTWYPAKWAISGVENSGSVPEDACPAHEGTGDELEVMACVTWAGLLLRGSAKLSAEYPTSKGNGGDALISLRWLHNCTVSSSSGDTLSVSLVFWGGLSVEMQVPSCEDGRAFEHRIRTLMLAQRTCYSLDVPPAVHASTLWVRHSWTVKLSSFIDEMSTASTLRWDESLVAFSENGQDAHEARHREGSAEHKGDRDKEVSSLISTASTRQGAESRGVQEFSRRRAATHAPEPAAAGSAHARPTAAEPAQAQPQIAADLVGGDLDTAELQSARQGKRDSRGVKFSRRDGAGALACEPGHADEERRRRGYDAEEYMSDRIPHEGERPGARDRILWPSDAREALPETRHVSDDASHQHEESWLLGHQAFPPDMDDPGAKAPAAPQRYARAWNGAAASSDANAGARGLVKGDGDSAKRSTGDGLVDHPLQGAVSIADMRAGVSMAGQPGTSNPATQLSPVSPGQSSDGGWT